MKRGYDSQNPNRYGYRGGYDNSGPSYRNSGSPFAHPSNNGSNNSSRPSSGQSSNSPHFEDHQFQPHAQGLPSLMSTAVPPPFTSTPPPSFTATQSSITAQFQQHQHLQQLIVRHQQQLPLKPDEHMILNQYYSLLGVSFHDPAPPAQKYLAMNQQQSHWPVSQNTPSRSHSLGYDQQGYPGQPPLPPPPPQQPPPPAPTEPPPPVDQDATYAFNNTKNDRNPWNNQSRGGQHEGQVQSQGHGRRRNRNRNNSNNPNNINMKSQQPHRQHNWSSDTNSPSCSSQSDLAKMNRSRQSASPSSTCTSTDTKTTKRNPGDSDDEFYENDGSQTTVNKRAKRKPMSAQNTCKEFNAEHSAKALELEHSVTANKLPTLILKFPDPELNKEVIKAYSKHIVHVHFQQPSTPRYCFVQLAADSDVAQVKEELSQIPFGKGFVVAEFKNAPVVTNEAAIEDIDPYTIYIGNLPTNVSVQRVKSFFPNAARIDIGFAQRMKYTRYAFVRYATVDEAFDGFHLAFKMDLGPRSLVIRFRRTRGNIGLNDADGQKMSKRKRKAQLDEEAIASEGLAPDMISECDLNPFSDDQPQDMPCSDDSNDSKDSKDSKLSKDSKASKASKASKTSKGSTDSKTSKSSKTTNNSKVSKESIESKDCNEEPEEEVALSEVSGDNVTVPQSETNVDLASKPTTPDNDNEDVGEKTLDNQKPSENNEEDRSTSNLVNIEAISVDVTKVKEEFPMHQYGSDDDELDDSSFNIVHIVNIPDDVLPIQIKTEPQSNQDISDEDDLDETALNTIHIASVTADVLPKPIKIEPTVNENSATQSVTAESIPTPVTAASTAIKKEYHDEFSDDEYFDDMPLGDDDSGSTFGDDEFMRLNNIVMDEIPEKPYWEQGLIDRKEIKKEDDVDKGRSGVRAGPSNSKTAEQLRQQTAELEALYNDSSDRLM